MHSESNVDISLQIFHFHYLVFVSIRNMNTFEESLCYTESNSVHLYGSSLNNHYNNKTLGEGNGIVVVHGGGWLKKVVGLSLCTFHKAEI